MHKIFAPKKIPLPSSKIRPKFGIFLFSQSYTQNRYFSVPEDIKHFGDLEYFFHVQSKKFPLPENPNSENLFSENPNSQNPSPENPNSEPHDLAHLNSIFEIPEFRFTEDSPKSEKLRSILEEISVAKSENFSRVNLQNFERWILTSCPLSFSHAFKILILMKTHNFLPSYGIYSEILISGLRKLTNLEISFFFGVESMKSTQIRSKAFISYQKVLEMMALDNFELQNSFYIEVSQACERRHNCEPLYSIFLKKTSENGHGPLPLVFFSVLLKYLYDSRDFVKLERVFSYMNGSHLMNPEMVSQHALFLMKNGKFQESYEIVRNSEVLLNKPTLYFGIFQALLDQNRLPAALLLLDSLHSRNALDPSYGNVFFRYFVKQNSTQRAAQVLKIFSSLGFPQYPIDFHYLIRLYARHDPQKTFHLWKRSREVTCPFNSYLCNAFLYIASDPLVSPIYLPLILKLPILDIPIPPILPNSLAAVLQPVAPIFASLIAALQSKFDPNLRTYKILMEHFYVLRRYQTVISIFVLIPKQILDSQVYYYYLVALSKLEGNFRDQINEIFHFLKSNYFVIPWRFMKILTNKWPELTNEFEKEIGKDRLFAYQEEEKDKKEEIIEVREIDDNEMEMTSTGHGNTNTM